MKTIENETLLTMDQVAEKLSIGRATVYRIIKDKELPVVRVGGVFRVAPEDLTAYIEKMKTAN